MKAIVLCAGLGTRLRPLTDTVPKPMIEIGEQPLLFHHLAALRDAGVTDVAINLHHLGEVIRDAVGDGERFGLRVVYHDEPELLGSAGALNGFPGFFDRTFLVVYGDVYHEVDYRALLFLHATRRATMTLVTHTVDDAAGKGVVRVEPETGRVLAFVEKPPSAPPGSPVNAGVYACEPVVAALVPPSASDFGGDLIPALVASGEPVYAYPTPSLVQDIGTPDGLARARTLAKRA